MYVQNRKVRQRNIKIYYTFMKEKKELKDKRLYLRLSSDELEIINRKAKTMGLSKTKYLITCALNRSIVSKADQSILMNMQKIGVNINQMAHIANSKKDTQTLEYLKSVLDNYHKEFEMIRVILQNQNR